MFSETIFSVAYAVSGFTLFYQTVFFIFFFFFLIYWRPLYHSTSCSSPLTPALPLASEVIPSSNQLSAWQLYYFSYRLYLDFADNLLSYFDC